MNEEAKVRERLATLENEFRHIDEKLDHAITSLGEVKDMMAQTKGAWKVLLGAAGFMGFISGLASWIIPPFFHR